MPVMRRDKAAAAMAADGKIGKQATPPLPRVAGRKAATTKQRHGLVVVPGVAGGVPTTKGANIVIFHWKKFLPWPCVRPCTTLRRFLVHFETLHTVLAGKERKKRTGKERR